MLYIEIKLIFMILLGNMHTHILPTHILWDESRKRPPMATKTHFWRNESTHNKRDVGNSVFCAVCAESIQWQLDKVKTRRSRVLLSWEMLTGQQQHESRSTRISIVGWSCLAMTVSFEFHVTLLWNYSNKRTSRYLINRTTSVMTTSSQWYNMKRTLHEISMLMYSL